jgi:hypothetical protein
MKIADFVGYIQMEGRNRVIDFSPTDEWVGKNPARWDKMAVPPIAQMDGYLARLIALGKDALNQIEEKSRVTKQEQDEWRVKLEAFTTAKEFNGVMGDILKLGPPNNAAVAQLSVAIAKTKGIELTGEPGKRKFIDPPKKEEPKDEPKADAPKTEDLKSTLGF